VLIAGHLLAIVLLVLGAPSGPWPVDEGYGYATPPHFVQETLPYFERYLVGTKFTHNYHFLENDVARLEKDHLETEFEVHLRDQEGKEIKTLRFPDKNATGMVRHRQGILASSLYADEMVEPRPGEFVPAPDQPIPVVTIWDSTGPRSAKLGTVQEHLIPRDRPVSAPSKLSMVLARSYARYLCREHNADSAEIVRYTRQLIPPDALYNPGDFPAEAFDEVTTSFGVINALKQTN
jgi:hypothetical protein